MTKHIFLTLLLFYISVFSLGAQSMTEMIVEKTDGLRTPFLACNEPSYGVLVFSSTIPGLEFKLNLQNRLMDVVYNRQENRYILCVMPTESRYIVTITCPTCETVKYTVEDIPPNDPLYFRIRDKQPSVASLSAQEQYDLGFAAYNRDDFAQAEIRYRNAVDMSSSSPVFEFLQSLGEVCIKQNKYAEAITFLRQATVVRPNNAAIHHLLGTAYYENGNYENAANSFKEAVDLAANNTQYRNDLQRAMNANPQREQGLLDMGDAYMRQYNYEEALNYYRDAAQIDTRNNSSLRTAQLRVNQERIMNTVDAAYKMAKATPKPDSNASQQAKDAYRMRYNTMFDEIDKALSLGTLPRYMLESVSFYEFDAEADLAGGYQNVSCGWLKDFLNKNPETPFRAQIEEGIKKCERPVRGELGIGVAYNNLLGVSALAGIRLFSCEQLVNLRVGLQFTYYMSDFYDGSSKPDKDKTWDIAASQLSLPVTLQLNIARMGINTPNPSSVFIAATAQPNFNISASFFGVTNSDFVEKIGYSGIATIGYSTKKLSFGVFARKNFTDLFKRDKIYEYDNQNGKNDYFKLDKCLENKLLFGASLGFYY